MITHEQREMLRTQGLTDPQITEAFDLAVHAATEASDKMMRICMTAGQGVQIVTLQLASKIVEQSVRAVVEDLVEIGVIRRQQNNG